jgi:hypothetical protein
VLFLYLVLREIALGPSAVVEHGAA